METNESLGRFADWLENAFTGLLSMFGEQRKTKRDANFASKSEILSPKNTGFCLDGSNNFISQEHSNRGMLLYAKSGGGKTSCVIIPSALRMTRFSSLVIHDPSSEAAGYISGYAASCGIPVSYVNLLQPERGGFNVLFRVRKSSDMKKLAHQIVLSALGKNQNDNFWNASATMFLSVIIEIVCAQPEELRNMYNVTYLVDVFSFNPVAIDKIVLRIAKSELTTAYKSLNSYEPKVLSSVIATVKSAIEIFKDEDVARATAYDTIDLDSYRTTPSILFVNSSLASLQYHSLVSSILFSQLCNTIMSKIPPPNSLPIYLLLDEASSLKGLQETLITGYANLRKYNAGILSCFQSYHQLCDLVSDSQARALKECCFINEYMPGQNLQTATEISQLLGDFEYEDEGGSKRVRNLLLPNEVRQNNKAIVFAGNLPGIQLNLQPFHDNPRLRKLTQIPPYYPSHPISPDLPPLIPLP